MKLSIIIPVYNGSPYLERLINSLIDCNINDYINDIEVIFVDDTSTDNSVDMIKNSGIMNQQLYIHEKNIGSSGARNTGFKYSIGERILFFDCDDKILRDFGVVLDNIKQNDEYDIISYGTMLKGNRLEYSNELLIGVIGNDYNPNKLMVSDNRIRTCIHDKFIRRNFIVDFDVLIYDYHEDSDFIYRVLKKNPSLIVLEGYLHMYIRNETSKTNWIKTHKTINEFKYILDKYKDDKNGWIHPYVEFTMNHFMEKLTFEERCKVFGIDIT